MANQISPKVPKSSAKSSRETSKNPRDISQKTSKSHGQDPEKAGRPESREANSRENHNEKSEQGSFREINLRDDKPEFREKSPNFFKIFAKALSFLKSHKFLLAALFLFAVAIISRLLFWPGVPRGINQDEAMAAVDAANLLARGTDRLGMTFPVTFQAWGWTTMTTLMSWCMMPSIGWFGFSPLAVRLPTMIISLLAILTIFLFAKKVVSHRTSLVILFIVALNPWQFMQSRWSLDCNYMPHFILFSLFFLYKGIREKSRPSLIFASILFGLTMYSYGPAIYVVPLLLLILAIYLIKTRQISPKHFALFSLIYLMISLPIFAMVVINFFHLPSISLPFLTIPNFPENSRLNDILLFSHDFWPQLFANLKSVVSMIFLQNDGFTFNALPIFGTLFPLFSAPLIFIGFFAGFKKLRENRSKLREKLIYPETSLHREPLSSREYKDSAQVTCRSDFSTKNKINKNRPARNVSRNDSGEKVRADLSNSLRQRFRKINLRLRESISREKLSIVPKSNGQGIRETKSNIRETNFIHHQLANQNLALVMLFAWLLVALISGLLINGVNISRFTMVWYPLAILMGLGLANIFAKISFSAGLALSASIAISFFLFLAAYFGPTGPSFYPGLGAAVTSREIQTSREVFISASHSGRTSESILTWFYLLANHQTTPGVQPNPAKFLFGPVNSETVRDHPDALFLINNYDVPYFPAAGFRSETFDNYHLMIPLSPANSPQGSSPNTQFDFSDN